MNAFTMRIYISAILGIYLCALATAEETSRDISFRNDAMAVLAKAGCNAGACHGNKNGKGGFKLSLRGQDPDLDYEALCRDVFARRTNPVDPDQSLILLKATAKLPHEGGARFKSDSLEYGILRDWIARGTPRDLERSPRLQRLEVTPAEQVLIEPADRVQIKVTGIFSDGSRKDVSNLTVFEQSTDLANGNETRVKLIRNRSRKKEAPGLHADDQINRGINKWHRQLVDRKSESGRIFE